jgi:hypothetical protein
MSYHRTAAGGVVSGEDDDEEIESLQLNPLPNDDADDPVLVQRPLPSPPLSPPVIIKSPSPSPPIAAVSPTTTPVTTATSFVSSSSNRSVEVKGSLLDASSPSSSSAVATSIKRSFQAAQLIGTRTNDYEFVAQLHSDAGHDNDGMGPSALYHVRLQRERAHTNNNDKNNNSNGTDLAMKVLLCKGESADNEVWMAFDAERKLISVATGIVPLHDNICPIYHHYFDTITPSTATRFVQWPGRFGDKVLCIVLPLVTLSLHDALAARGATLTKDVTPSTSSSLSLDPLPLLRLRELLITAAGLSRSLYHLHAHRIVHRHISSQSIWLTTDTMTPRSSLLGDIAIGDTRVMLGKWWNKSYSFHSPLI